MASVNMTDLAGNAAGSVDLPDEVFGRDANNVLLHEVVVREQAALRQGTHATRTRGLVSGGGKKPWRQKGTGRARAGSNRSPLWKGGGTTFGPQPRSYTYRMPRKKVRRALEVALSDALREGRLTCVESFHLETAKTKGFVQALGALGAEQGTMVVVDELTENLALASRNVPGVVVVEAHDVTPYDVVVSRRLIAAKAALEQMGGAGRAA